MNFTDNILKIPYISLGKIGIVFIVPSSVVK